ncbi:MAG: LuxR family transcriptional regulator [Hyphomicrobiales bacterium]|nr:LuxR family transcriptional regulator [Hyphomicrobiales bacterium]MCP4998492.1 LuxR family transcriptional regulator [Hyphomicrobiales bacterium]
MITTAIIDFLESINDLETQPEIIDRLEAVMDACGFDYYGVIRQPKASEDPLSLVLAGRWPEGWPARYMQKKYVLIDPTIRFLGHARKGFNWAEAIPAFQSDPHRRRMQRMMIDALKFGLEGGYIFPIHGRRGLMGNLSVGGKQVPLNPLEMTLFDVLAKMVFWRLLELSDPIVNEELSSTVDVQLTRREMEALSYLADGMTSNEIASVLNLSNHTVDWYMNALQIKLRAKNRHHAVAIAFRLGLIS